MGGAVVVICSGGLAWYLGRGTNFVLDEWNIILYRHSGGLETVLTPYNGHLFAVPILVYRVLVGVAGLHSYAPVQDMGLAIHVACGGLLFTYARRRVPGPLAMAATALFMLCGYAFVGSIWPHETLVDGLPCAAVTLSFLLIDGTSRWRWAMVTLAMTIAVATFSVALPLLIALGVELVLERRRLRALASVAIPGALYVLWFVSYRSSTAFLSEVAKQAGSSPLQAVGGPRVSPDRLTQLPDYVRGGMTQTVSALLGTRPEGRRREQLLLVLVVVTLGAGVMLGRRSWPRLVALVVALLCYWSFLGFGYLGMDRYPSRYFYPAVFLLVMLIIEVAAGFTLPKGAVVAATTLAAVSVGLSTHELWSNSRFLREASEGTRAKFAALEMAHERVAPAFELDPGGVLFVRAGPYFAVSRQLGSPAESTGAVLRDSTAARAAADDVLIRSVLQDQGRRRSAAPGLPSLEGLVGGHPSRQGGCVSAEPTGAGMTLVVALPPGRYVVTTPQGTPVHMSLRRFGDTFDTETFAQFTWTAHASLALPADGLPLAWHASLRLDVPISVCGDALGA